MQTSEAKASAGSEQNTSDLPTCIPALLILNFIYSLNFLLSRAEKE